jgi:hypothetical protein
MKTFYCKTCQDTIDAPSNEIAKCKGCSKIFNKNEHSIKNYTNMRTTWSGQTKVEFNTITVDESIKKMQEGK